ncbi:MAG: Tad domain-containing protein [Pseudomonadota bacterium]
MSWTKGITMFRSGFVGKRLKRFQKDEEGSLIIFSMFIFLTMIIFGGVAVDLMLYENRRVYVQNATDRSVLAAANLKQTVPAKEVVKDYLAKVGIDVDDEDIYLREVGAQPVVTGRQVAVKVEAESPTILMNMIGIDTLPYGSVSSAEQSVNDVEVSLILDVSGSMGWNGKLGNMQTAAKRFVEGVLEGSDDNRVSVSLVPYSTQVSVGPELIDRITTEHEHEFSHCVNFEEEDFDTTAIHRYRPAVDNNGMPILDADGNQVIEPIPLSQTASFDPWRGWNSSRSLRYPVCRDQDYVDILPWSNSIGDLTDQIDDLTASGNTSIDVAMKWGTALLDPSMNPALVSLKDDTGDGIDIDAEFVVRPRPHDYEDVLKFIVLMTDGINTTQYELRDEDKEGMSNMYWYRNDHWLAVVPDDFDDSDGPAEYEDMEFWNLDDQCWHYQYGGDCNGWRKPDEDDQLTKLEMWNEMTLAWRAFHGFYSRIEPTRAARYYEQIGGIYGYDGPRQTIVSRSNNPNADTKDARLSDICDAAKDAGIVVFTIGFEVTDESADIMEACASSDQHFYRVNGQDIQYAFASITNKINQLKLTQ